MRAQPPESELALAGATPHAGLPPAFKGAFVLNALGGGLAQAVVDTAARDPVGGGWARAVTWYEASPRHVAGDVSRGVRETGLRGTV